MSNGIGRDEFAQMIAGAAALIRQQHARLSELDSASGDGDHGVTMVRVADRLENAFSKPGAADLRACLREAGWSVLGADGGASSSLLGAFFLGMADAPQCREPVGSAELAAIFEAGFAALRKHTKAQPGDKTLLDALVPAIDALRAAADTGRTATDAIGEAALAAQAGADATGNLTARYGRARSLGEKTLGFPDPGALSIALMFEGFRRGLANSKGVSGNA
jgi:dihydroxyacetone kinase-like protein